jgi:hypothetical protein
MPTTPNPSTTPTGRRLARKAQVPQVNPETIALPVPIHRFRVLFADGALVDFLASWDTSDTRGQMLDRHYGKRPAKDRHNDPTYRIEGIAHLGQEYVYTPEPASDHTPS